MIGSWRDNPLVRVLGSAASWFLYTMSFTLLLNSAFGVMLLGGSCASGGPYEIAVECPPEVALFAPLSIFAGLASVALGAFLAQGFGTPLTTWSWPVLFCGLGALFLLEFFVTGDPTGLILGLMFEIMGLVPLVFELRGSPQRVFLGQRSAGGEPFLEGDRARRTMLSPMVPNPDGAVAPTAGSWAASLGILVVSVAGGYLAAQSLFAAVANSGAR
jgi:hypothetical protein